MKFDNLKAVLLEFAELVSDRYKDSLPVASGELKDSVKYSVKVTTNGFQAIINVSEVWKFIEQGRKAGSKAPPPDAILRWIEVVPIIPQPYQLPTGRTVIPTNKQLAFLIGRKIARDGINPRPLLKEAVEYYQDDLIEILTRAFAEDVKIYLSE